MFSQVNNFVKHARTKYECSPTHTRNTYKGDVVMNFLYKLNGACKVHF